MSVHSRVPQSLVSGPFQAGGGYPSQAYSGEGEERGGVPVSGPVVGRGTPVWPVAWEGEYPSQVLGEGTPQIG